MVEGRDIGSVVWPQAEVKVYLTADPAARAARRALEEGGSDVGATEAVLLSVTGSTPAGRPRRW